MNNINKNLKKTPEKQKQKSQLQKHKKNPTNKKTKTAPDQ